jgi:hypothetical protein
MSEHGRGPALPHERGEDRTSASRRRARRAGSGGGRLPGPTGTALAVDLPTSTPSLDGQTTPGLPVPPLPGPTDNPPPVGEPPSTGGGADVDVGAGGTNAGAGAGQGGGGTSGGGNHPTINIVNHGTSNSYHASAAPTAAAPAGAFIAPFPVVHIRGRILGSRVQIQRLAVSAPTGAAARVTCRGGRRKGCPRTASKTRATRGSTYVRFSNAERTLRGGAKIEVRVTKPGLIGKFTRFSVRSRKVPLRSDACLPPGTSRSSPCP